MKSSPKLLVISRLENNNLSLELRSERENKETQQDMEREKSSGTSVMHVPIKLEDK